MSRQQALIYFAAAEIVFLAGILLWLLKVLPPAIALPIAAVGGIGSTLLAPNIRRPS